VVWWGCAKVLGRLGRKPSPHPRACALSCPSRPTVEGPGSFGISALRSAPVQRPKPSKMATWQMHRPPGRRTVAPEVGRILLPVGSAPALLGNGPRRAFLNRISHLARPSLFPAPTCALTEPLRVLYRRCVARARRGCDHGFPGGAGTPTRNSGAPPVLCATGFFRRVGAPDWAPALRFAPLRCPKHSPAR
jgi:hypothetical protein